MTGPTISRRSVVIDTPWFDLVGKAVSNDDQLHYSIATRDYVSVFAITANNTFPLVRQFRPAVEMVTLELPSGHVEDDEDPQSAARKELREETGFIANDLILLGTLSPDTGRLSNRMWCFFAPAVERCPSSTFKVESGIEAIEYDRPLRHLVTSEPGFTSALNRAAILMAVAHRYVEL